MGSVGAFPLRFSFFSTKSKSTLARLVAALLCTAFSLLTLSALSKMSCQGRSLDFIPSSSSFASTCEFRNVLSLPKGNIPSSGQKSEEASLLGFTS